MWQEIVYNYDKSRRLIEVINNDNNTFDLNIIISLKTKY